MMSRKGKGQSAHYGSPGDAWAVGAALAGPDQRRESRLKRLRGGGRDDWEA